MSSKLSFIQLLLSCTMAFSFTSHSSAQEESTALRIMSFNIRQGVAKDGDNHWDKRKDFVVATIKGFEADIVGTQETWDFQAKYLSDNLAGFTYVGRSRQKDNRGEQCGILFKTDRFDKLIEGHFWLSENPEEPGSKSWDSSLPRMATWLKLWDRTNKRTIYIINTHFDHRGQDARNESAKLVRQFINDLPRDSDVVVTGDFNAGEDSAPYKSLFAELESVPSPLVDTFRVQHSERTKNEGTFNGFKGTKNGARIDWIAATRRLKIQSAEIDRTSFNKRFPSDHCPVTCVVEFEKR